MPKQPRKPDEEPRSGRVPGHDSVSHSESHQTHEEILAYWTPERMADAKPRELRLPEPAPRPTQDDARPAPDNS
ncbi:hypothetical protein [Pseudarthrobacter sulfonivorans]|uniref:hypothetical protein n=1 Tax=Pseudarthrobacter sulfonivorans TaxID=121292 RepID=UPI002854C4F7|nr:hypothetical protein [Pseudarthrobacter sulfonivorans]MDR6415467.1 hypothetical protein [Pseudarthrobacter sulfonivorans]